MPISKKMMEQVASLVNTSIEDARSSTRVLSLDVLVEAQKTAAKRGMKSMARMLQTQINKRKKSHLAEPANAG